MKDLGVAFTAMTVNNSKQETKKKIIQVGPSNLDDMVGIMGQSRANN